ncbi:MAG: L-2-hydroxyglutarate oxidase [Paracoccus denitrificans]|nr:MAG: L-2-hydroxyglutarate oxidase [Paracoccus denitrificans]PZO85539.1 MAG: L-2-hydroxyglutarate oxidase [Paracoccus denitrificans]
MQRIAVIGAGINGLALARQIMMDAPDAKITIFEKEAMIAAHQSSHNSGVVHAGLYYEPGGLKARLCTRGASLIRDYCAEQGLPFDECGKVVVALSEDELPRLDAIYRKSVANGVPGVRMIGPDELREIEPNGVGIRALYSPHTAIVSYGAIAARIATEIQGWGATLRLSSPVARLSEKAEGVWVEGADGPIDEKPFDRVIACAGLQSDRLAQASGDEDDPRIVPFFGQYYVVDPAFRNHVKGLIYPVPDPNYPFLGVHFTKRIDGEMTIGPNAFISIGRENYSGRRFSLRDAANFGLYPGFWKFAARNMAVTAREMRTVVSKGTFVREAARYVPSLSTVSVTPAVRGIRAQAMTRDGRLVDDFVIRTKGRVTHIRNAPSPGATSSMAIAEYIVRDVLKMRETSSCRQSDLSPIGR